MLNVYWRKQWVPPKRPNSTATYLVINENVYRGKQMVSLNSRRTPLRKVHSQPTILVTDSTIWWLIKPVLDANFWLLFSTCPNSFGSYSALAQIHFTHSLNTITTAMSQFLSPSLSGTLDLLNLAVSYSSSRRATRRKYFKDDWKRNRFDFGFFGNRQFSFGRHYYSKSRRRAWCHSLSKLKFESDVKPKKRKW